MPSIPLPFVVSLVLCLVLVRMGRQGRERFGLFGWLVAMCAVQAFLSGMHWGLGWQATRIIQPVIAALLPALTFVAFEELRRGGAASSTEHLPHLVPAAVVLGLVVLWRSPIDVVLFAIYLGYGLALLHAARRGPDGLSSTRLGDSASAHKALVAIAVLLIVTAFVDFGVSLALVFGDARQEIVVRMARAIEFRNGETGAHVERIAHISKGIAETLGLANPLVDDIHFASPMHEIGKLAVPDSIPSQARPAHGRGTARNAAAHRQGTCHPLRQSDSSAAMRRRDRALPSRTRRCRGISEWVEGERYTPAGAERRRGGCIDALTSARPYKAAWSRDKAMTYLVAQKGTQFDPVHRMISDRKVNLPSESMH